MGRTSARQGEDECPLGSPQAVRPDVTLLRPCAARLPARSTLGESLHAVRDLLNNVSAI